MRRDLISTEQSQEANEQLEADAEADKVCDDRKEFMGSKYVPCIEKPL